MKNGILAVLEKREGRLSMLSAEILSEAERLAYNAGCPLKAAVLESNAELLDTCCASSEIAEMVKTHAPRLVLLGATPAGIEIAVKMASKLGEAVLCDCIDIKYSAEKGFCMVRPDPSGRSNMIMNSAGTAVVTVRPGIFAAHNEGETDRRSEHPLLEQFKVITSTTASFKNKDIELISMTKDKKLSSDITKAPILVAGGRGAGGPEGFAMLKKLADILGGEVAASRACIEAGWTEPFRQVGQTGKTVHPKLYIACGISGAIQHVTGMKDSECIIAINKNPAAPIFDIADLGIVGNLENILPALIKSLQEKKGGTNAI